MIGWARIGLGGYAEGTTCEAGAWCRPERVGGRFATSCSPPGSIILTGVASGLASLPTVPKMIAVCARGPSLA